LTLVEDELFERLRASQPPVCDEESISETIESLDAYVKENGRFLESIEHMGLGISRQEMEVKRAAWDIEA
jgi:hypothetical protein